MKSDNLFESIKENLNGRPGQPIILGVCSTLAERLKVETWVVRAAAIVLGVFFTWVTLVAYILAGFIMKETEDRTRGVFQGLMISIREAGQKFSESFRDLGTR